MPEEIIGHPKMGNWVKFYQAHSDSNPRLTYVISRPEGEGRWGCSCPRWIYSHKDCRHIARIKHELAGAAPIKQVQPTEQIKEALHRLSRAAFVEI